MSPNSKEEVCELELAEYSPAPLEFGTINNNPTEVIWAKYVGQITFE